MNGLFKWWKIKRQEARRQVAIDDLKTRTGVEDSFFQKDRTVFGVTIEWQAPTWWVRWDGK